MFKVNLSKKKTRARPLLLVVNPSNRLCWTLKSPATTAKRCLNPPQRPRKLIHIFKEDLIIDVGRDIIADYDRV